MRNEKLIAIFDQQASGYDKQWAMLAPIRDGLHFLMESVFADLPADAEVLCVGVGTGVEMAHLASRFPSWRFTAIDPSAAMLDVCRIRADNDGFLSRCRFHEGYVDELPWDDEYDAATCLMVSHFIMETEARSTFFRAIAALLRPGAILVSSDLAAEVGSNEHAALVRVWLSLMTAAGASKEALEKMRAAWATDVAILHPTKVASIIEAGGFGAPVQFYQAGLIHAWFAHRALGT